MSPPLPQINTDFDGHVHTYLCGHAHGTMEEYILSALSKGIGSLCFLEHLEVEIKNVPKSWLDEIDFQLYFKQGKALKKKYQDQITVLTGVEAGYNPGQKESFLQKLQTYPWDRIGLSNHFVTIENEFLNVLSRKKYSLNKLAAHGFEKVAHIYYTSILEALHIMERCDVVCHLDAVMRHHHTTVMTNKHWDLIEKILEKMREKDIALELNTSGFSLKKRPYPAKEIIAAAIQKGVRLQAGSDAHAPQQVGRHFNKLQHYLDREVAALLV